MHTLFGLTSHVLLIATIVVAVAAPCGLVRFVVRRRREPASRRRLLGLGAAGLGLALVAQAAAVAAVFLAINGQYQFYSGWGDLLGRQGAPAAITVSGAHPGRGRVEILHVDGKESRTRADVLAWLPPEYGEPAYAHHRFPVVMFLPGQPEAPQGAFEGFQLAQAAENEITAHKVPPFVIVVPPLMVRPPSDTECTDIPRGPKAESWLSSDVPTAIRHDLRVQRPGKHWSVMGWSTGGFCAAKLLYGHPDEFAAGVGIGAYYQPITDKTWPNLFGSSVAVKKHNSPQWLYLHHAGGLSQRLLVISSKQDGESWASSEKMLVATHGNPLVSHVALGSGGHNFGVYQPYVQTSLQWLDHGGSLA